MAKDVLMLLRVIRETFLSTFYLCGKITSSKLSGKSSSDFISVTPGQEIRENDANLVEFARHFPL